MKNRIFFVLFSTLSVMLTGCGSETTAPETTDTSSFSTLSKSEGHEHNFSSVWSSDETHHWHKCNGCDEIKDKSEHVFGEWVIDDQPTETKKGKRHHRCNICYYVAYEEMDVVEHVHDWDTPKYTWTYDYSKCTAKRECKLNRYHYEEETVNSVYRVVTEPTTESTGVGRYTATFTNASFATQYKDVVINKLDTPVTGVELYPSTLSLSIGDTSILVESVLPSTATNKNVTWSSSNASVASVSSSGFVKALAKGNATITVTTVEGGFTAKCEVSVADISVTGISLSSSTISLEEGKTKTIYAYVEPTHATNKNVVWSSNNTAVATVNQNGLITAVKSGNATISATTEDGGFVATCAVEVLEKENFSYLVGDTVVEIYDYTSYSSTTKKVKVYTPITNNGNVNIYISTCTIDIEDSRGNLMQSLSSVSAKPDIVKPGETTFLYDEQTYKGSVYTNLVGVPHPTIKNGKSADSTRYSVSNVALVADSIYGVKANGTMTNNTTKTTGMVYVSLNLFDKNDKFIATLFKIIYDDIAPGGSVEFTATCLNLMYHDYAPSDIGRYEAYAYEWTIVF